MSGSTDNDKAPLLHDDGYSSLYSNSVPHSAQTHHHDDTDMFYDVTERTSSSASMLSHHSFYDVRDKSRAPSPATTSHYDFYDPAETTNVVNNDGKDDVTFYDVKERAASSLSQSTRYGSTLNTYTVGTGIQDNLVRVHDYNQDQKQHNTRQTGSSTVPCRTSSTRKQSRNQDDAKLFKDDGRNSNSNSNSNSSSNSSSNSPHSPSSSSPATAQLVSTLILILYAIALVPAISLTSQYLTVRWRLEAGRDASDHLANSSACGGDGDDVNNASSKDTFEDRLSARVSDTVTNYNYIISGTSIIACLFLGAYSDVIGRRVIILAPSLSAVLHFIIIICIMRFDLDTSYFYASSAVIGSGGSFYAMLIGVFTVTADVNDGKSKRLIWLALQMCVTSGALALGNIGLGYAIEYIGFYQAAIMLEMFAIIALFVAVLYMPETLPEERKRQILANASLNPFKLMGRALRIYTSEGSRRNRRCLRLCLLLFFFAVIPDLQLYTLDTIFQLHRPLCWDSTQIGYYGAIQTGGKKLAGTVLLQFLQTKGWIKVEKLAMLVCVFQLGSMILQALLQHSWQMYLVPVIGTPSIITVPVIRGIMSFLVGRQNLGALFASIAVIETICSVVAATSVNRVYTATVGFMPGAVYFLMAAFAAVTFLLFIPFFFLYDDPTTKIKIEQRHKASASA